MLLRRNKKTPLNSSIPTRKPKDSVKQKEKRKSFRVWHFPTQLTPISGDDASRSATGFADDKRRSLWTRGGRCFVGFLVTGGVHGKKTPVPASILLGAGASITNGGAGVPGRHRVGGGWTLPESGLSLKKVIATLLLGEGHITCLAISALLPLITSNDLRHSF